MKAPRFMTKKEKEAREAIERKKIEFKEKQKRMKELEKEIEQMQKEVFAAVKDPNIKRRHTVTSFVEMLPKDQQNRKNLPSCFGDDVSFNEYTAKKE